MYKCVCLFECGLEAPKLMLQFKCVFRKKTYISNKFDSPLSIQIRGTRLNSAGSDDQEQD